MGSLAVESTSSERISNNLIESFNLLCCVCGPSPAVKPTLTTLIFVPWPHYLHFNMIRSLYLFVCLFIYLQYTFRKIKKNSKKEKRPLISTQQYLLHCSILIYSFTMHVRIK